MVEQRQAVLRALARRLRNLGLYAVPIGSGVSAHGTPELWEALLERLQVHQQTQQQEAGQVQAVAEERLIKFVEGLSLLPQEKAAGPTAGSPTGGCVVGGKQG